ncbi:MAG: hypothetical protein WA001_04245 [Patescibacteria group bacterium]
MIAAALAFGALAGAFLLFLAHVAPSFGAGNFVRDIDEPHFFGRDISHREAHFLGMLMHLTLSGIFGGLYAYFVSAGVFTDYSLLPILGWGFLTSVFIGGVILPLEGHGIFGIKEDAWFPIDLVLTSLVWAVLFWGLMHLWPSLIS